MQKLTFNKVLARVLHSIYTENFLKCLFNTIYGGTLRSQACYWLKQAFYKIEQIGQESQRESLTLSDLKKTDVLNLA